VARILLFHPNNPWPVRSGSDRRFWEVATALRQLGWDTHLASASYTSVRPWTVDAVEALHAEAIRLWLAPPLTPWRGWAKRRARRRYDDSGRFAALARSVCPSPLKRHFQKLVGKLSPDRILIFYSLWSDLLPRSWRHRPEALVDTNDLISRNQALQRGEFPGADPGEWRALARFGRILSLSEAEAEEISFHVRESRTLHVPMCASAESAVSDLEGEGVLFASDNPFNRKGGGFLAEEVLPRPEADFRLQVFGHSAVSHPKLDEKGVVDDVNQVYRHARFLACPAASGTGEQWKIVEALSHGVPVVALESGVRGAPLIHGENGFIVKDGAEFARRCLQLSKDPALAKQMGRAALETIHRVRPRSRLVEGLASALAE